MLTAERLRLATAHPAVRASITAALEALAKLLDDTEGELLRHVAEHHAAAESLLRSVAGIGPTTAATLIAQLPELGRLNHLCARRRRPDEPGLRTDARAARDSRR